MTNRDQQFKFSWELLRWHIVHFSEVIEEFYDQTVISIELHYEFLRSLLWIFLNYGLQKYNINKTWSST